MNQQSGTQIMLSTWHDVSITSDPSTIVYVEGDVLFFYGAPLSLEMIQEWFGGEDAFLDLVNQGPDAVQNWAIENIPAFAEAPASLENLGAGGIDTQTSASGSDALDWLLKAFASEWENSIPSNTGQPVLVASVDGSSIAPPASIEANAPTAATDTNYGPGFSTFIDGSQGEILRDIAFDSVGNIYVTGGTQSFQNMPITPGNDYYNSVGADTSGFFRPHDVFIQKYDPSGNLVWSTRMGGKNYDRAYGIEVDDNGSVYVAGRAGEGFYVTQGVLQEDFGHNTPASKNKPYGQQDGFVAKLDADTGQVDWSTYFGGEAGEIVRDIDVDANGIIHIAQTYILDATNQHITADAMQPTMRGSADNLYAQLSNDGTTLLYGTYIGGDNDTFNKASNPSIVVDKDGDINMVMTIDADNAPTSAGAFRTTPSGKNDYYIVKLDGATDGRTIKSATYFGSEDGDYAETHQLAVDDAGNMIVAGETTGRFLPGVTGGFQSSYMDGGSDGFIAVIAADGTDVLASTYFGGSGRDNIEGIFVNDDGIYISGTTSSADLAVTDRSYFGGYKGGSDAFIAKFSHDLSELLYASYVGGSGNDQGRALAVSHDGTTIAFGGLTTSKDFVIQNAEDGYIAGTDAAFLTTAIPVGPPPIAVQPDHEITIRASAKLYQGGAEAVVKVDGTVVDTISVSADRWQNETDRFVIDAGVVLDGTQEIQIEYINDLEDSSGNRNLFIHDVTLAGDDVPLGSAQITSTIGSYNISSDIVFLGTNGALVFQGDDDPLPPTSVDGQEIVITASARLYQGGAEALVKVDGTVVDTITVSADRWQHQTETFTIDAGVVLDGSQEIEIEYVNDLQDSSGNRNLFIHDVILGSEDARLGEADITSTVGSYNKTLDIIFLGTNGSAVFEADPPVTGQGSVLTLVATATPYLGAAEADVMVNGSFVGSIAVSADRTKNELDTFDISISTAAEDIDTIEIEFTNDLFHAGVGDRNLVIDEVAIDGVYLDESLVDITPGRGEYYSWSTFVSLWANGSATFDMALQDDIFGA